MKRIHASPRWIRLDSNCQRLRFQRCILLRLAIVKTEQLTGSPVEALEQSWGSKQHLCLVLLVGHEGISWWHHSLGAEVANAYSHSCVDSVTDSFLSASNVQFREPLSVKVLRRPSSEGTFQTGRPVACRVTVKPLQTNNGRLPEREDFQGDLHAIPGPGQRLNQRLCACRAR